jgi:hypothetical protein
MSHKGNAASCLTRCHDHTHTKKGNIGVHVLWFAAMDTESSASFRLGCLVQRGIPDAHPALGHERY